MKINPLRLIISLFESARRVRTRVSNFLKMRSRRKPEYIVIELRGRLYEYEPDAPRWQRFLPIFGFARSKKQFTMHKLRDLSKRIRQDPRTKGVIFQLEGFSPAWTAAENIRSLIFRIKSAGKRVIVHSNSDLDLRTYYFASAADHILIPPGANWMVLGLRAESLFLKEALSRVGIEAEVLAVSPFKTAGDMFQRTGFSPESLEMTSWLVDGLFDHLVGGIAAGRKLSTHQVENLIDSGPLTADDALENGLIDGVRYFDEIISVISGGFEKSENQKPILMDQNEAWTRLRRPIEKRSRKTIAIIPIQGLIVSGDSQSIPVPLPIPMIGNRQAGSRTISSLIQAAERDDKVAGVVVYIDSRGGSALASDLIWNDIRRLAKKKPVVAYMDSTAASGGYYVSSAADWIVSQPMTMTGSIGVLFVKFLTVGLLTKGGVKREAVQRGKRAGLYQDSVPLGVEERQVVMDGVNAAYDQFKERVLVGRDISDEDFSKIAGGRVWLGMQALSHGLVDELGDLGDGVNKVRELAGIPDNELTRLEWITGPVKKQLPVSDILEEPNSLLNGIARPLLKDHYWMIPSNEIKFL